jgi:hypothetical protein
MRVRGTSQSNKGNAADRTGSPSAHALPSPSLLYLSSPPPPSLPFRTMDAVGSGIIIWQYDLVKMRVRGTNQSNKGNAADRTGSPSAHALVRRDHPESPVIISFRVNIFSNYRRKRGWGRGGGGGERGDKLFTNQTTAGKRCR